jgi:hypothetical protein
MSTYWDKQQIDIVNNSGATLTVSNVGALEHGEWDTYPVSSIAQGATASPAFITRSVNAAEVGPGPGAVSYSLPDGTSLNISFDMSFAVGQNTYAQATAGGPRGSNYNVTLTCSEDSWHGQGRRYNGTLTIAPGTGNSAYCNQTN